MPIHQVKRSARSLSRIQRFVNWNDQGLSYADIAQRENCSTKTVERGLKRYIETLGAYPTGLDAPEIQRRRAEKVHGLEEFQRKILLRLTNLSEPENFHQEVEAISITAQAAQAYVKVTDQIGKLLGLHCAIPKAPEIHNTLQLNGTNQEEALKALVAYKLIQTQNARS